MLFLCVCVCVHPIRHWALSILWTWNLIWSLRLKIVLSSALKIYTTNKMKCQTVVGLTACLQLCDIFKVLFSSHPCESHCISLSIYLFISSSIFSLTLSILLVVFTQICAHSLYNMTLTVILDAAMGNAVKWAKHFIFIKFHASTSFSKWNKNIKYIEKKTQPNGKKNESKLHINHVLLIWYDMSAEKLTYIHTHTSIRNINHFGFPSHKTKSTGKLQKLHCASKI